MTTNEAISTAVVQLLAARREQRQTMARALGHSPSWASQKLRGDRGWTGEDLDALAAYFGVTPATFLLAGAIPRATDTRGYQPQMAA